MLPNVGAVASSAASATPPSHTIEPSASGEQLARRFSPPSSKLRQKVLYRGTLEPNVGIAPGKVGMAVAEPLVVDAEPARPADPGVDYDPANVGTVLDHPEIAKPERPERDRANAGLSKRGEVGLLQSTCAERVVQKEHLHSPPAPVRRGISCS